MSQQKKCYKWEHETLRGLAVDAFKKANPNTKKVPFYFDYNSELSKKKIKTYGQEVSDFLDIQTPEYKFHLKYEMRGPLMMMWGVPAMILTSPLFMSGSLIDNIHYGITENLQHFIPYTILTAFFCYKAIKNLSLMGIGVFSNVGARYQPASHSIVYGDARCKAIVLHEHAHALRQVKTGENEGNAHGAEFVGIVCRLYAEFLPEIFPKSMSVKDRENYLLNSARDAGLAVAPYKDFIAKYPSKTQKDFGTPGLQSL